MPTNLEGLQRFTEEEHTRTLEEMNKQHPTELKFNVKGEFMVPEREKSVKIEDLGIEFLPGSGSIDFRVLVTQREANAPVGIRTEGANPMRIEPSTDLLDEDLDAAPSQEVGEFVYVLELREVVENQDDDVRAVVVPVDGYLAQKRLQLPS